MVERMNQAPDNTEAMDALEKYVLAVEAQLDDFAANITYSRKARRDVGRCVHC